MTMSSRSWLATMSARPRPRKASSLVATNSAGVTTRTCSPVTVRVSAVSMARAYHRIAEAEDGTERVTWWQHATPRFQRGTHRRPTAEATRRRVAPMHRGRRGPAPPVSGANRLRLADVSSIKRLQQATSLSDVGGRVLNCQARSMRTITKIRMKQAGPVFLWVTGVCVVALDLPPWLIAATVVAWLGWSFSIRCPACGGPAQALTSGGTWSFSAFWITKCARCGQDYRER